VLPESRLDLSEASFQKIQQRFARGFHALGEDLKPFFEHLQTALIGPQQTPWITFLTQWDGMGNPKGSSEAQVGLPVAVESVILGCGCPTKFLGPLTGGKEDLELGERTHALCRAIREPWQGGGVRLELAHGETHPLTDQSPQKSWI
jgi:hypothetical protein